MGAQVCRLPRQYRKQLRSGLFPPGFTPRSTSSKTPFDSYPDSYRQQCGAGSACILLRHWRQKERAAPLHGRPWMVLCELHQVAESMGDTPCSFLHMGIAINMVTYVALWPEFKEITASCIAFLPLKSNLLLRSLNYSRMCSIVKQRVMKDSMVKKCLIHQ